MSIVMGIDQHRAQITAEWIDLASGEISRARVRPADRVVQVRLDGRLRHVLAGARSRRSSDSLGRDSGGRPARRGVAL